MALSFTIVRDINVTAQKFIYYVRITSLQWKREERPFVDLRIILMLHCGNEILKQILNFFFKLDDIVPRYGSTIKSSYLGTVGITFFRNLKFV